MVNKTAVPPSRLARLILFTLDMFSFSYAFVSERPLFSGLFQCMKHQVSKISIVHSPSTASAHMSWRRMSVFCVSGKEHHDREGSTAKSAEYLCEGMYSCIPSHVKDRYGPHICEAIIECVDFDAIGPLKCKRRTARCYGDVDCSES